MFEKEQELLTKSVTDFTAVASEYEESDLTKSMVTALSSVQDLLKSIVTKVAEIDTKVASGGNNGESLAKSLGTEMKEVLEAMEKAMTSLNERVTAVEKSPAERKGILAKSELLTKIGNIVNQRDFGSGAQEDTMLKSLNPARIGQILMKGIENKAVPQASVTRFELGGERALTPQEIAYIQSQTAN